MPKLVLFFLNRRSLVLQSDANAMAQSLEAGKVVTLDHVGTFADG